MTAARYDRRMKRTIGIVVATLVWAGQAGCGGEDDCAKLGYLICEKSADCAGDGKARFASGGGATLTFDSESDCKSLYVTLGCSGDTEPVADPAACITAVEAASCVMTTEGMALAYPDSPACEDPPAN